MEVSIDNEVEGSIDFAFPMTNTEIRLATQLWLKDPSSAEKKYGPVGLWNVSYVTDMRDLFRDASHFNEDISRWDVSRVITMSSMFQSAATFDQDIGRWDVKNVMDFSDMFYGAEAVNKWCENSIKRKFYQSRT